MGKRVTVTTGWLIMAAMLLTSKQQTTRNTVKIKYRSTTSSSLGLYAGSGCVGISDTARRKIASGLSSSPACCPASGGSGVNGSLACSEAVIGGLDPFSSTCMVASPYSRGGSHAASLMRLRLLLCGGKRLPIIHETDDLLTAFYMNVQVWFAIPIAIFKTQGDRC